MIYPKPLMSISELKEMGFSKRMLEEYAHMKNSPAFKTPGGGKWLFDTEKLDKKIQEMNESVKR